MSTDLVAAAGSSPDYFSEPDKQPRPYVQFETRSVERRVGQGDALKIEHHDVVFAIIRPPGSRDSVEKIASEWIASLHTQAEAGRIPQHWPRAYNEALQAFIKGEALPLEGTPIKMWAALTPSERKIVLASDVFTVEGLALANSDVLTRLGMGGLRLIELAKAYVADKNGNGKLTVQLDALRVENQGLKTQLEELMKAVEALRAQVPGATKATLEPAK